MLAQQAPLSRSEAGLLSRPEGGLRDYRWRARPVPVAPTVRPPMARSRRARAAQKGRLHSPMTAAVLTATFLVSLLCFYVSAYARVTSEVFELSNLRRQLTQEQQTGDALKAEVSRLGLPGAIQQRALALGMQPAPPEALLVIPRNGEEQASTPPQNIGKEGTDGSGRFGELQVATNH